MHSTVGTPASCQQGGNSTLATLCGPRPSQLAAAAQAVLRAARTPGAAPLFLVLPVFEVRPPMPAAAGAAAAASLEPQPMAAAAGDSVYSRGTAAKGAGEAAATGLPGADDEAAAAKLPRTKAALASFPGGARPFQCGVFPQDQESVDYAAWWVAAAGLAAVSSGEDSSSGPDHGGADGPSTPPALGLLPVPYFDFFEPVGVAAAMQLPRWDERFRGYGLNKVQLGAHLSALGFEFKVRRRLMWAGVEGAPSLRLQLRR